MTDRGEHGERHRHWLLAVALLAGGTGIGLGSVAAALLFGTGLSPLVWVTAVGRLITTAGIVLAWSSLEARPMAIRLFRRQVNRLADADVLRRVGFGHRTERAGRTERTERTGGVKRKRRQRTRHRSRPVVRPSVQHRRTSRRRPGTRSSVSGRVRALMKTPVGRALSSGARGTCRLFRGRLRFPFEPRSRPRSQVRSRVRSQWSPVFERVGTFLSRALVRRA